VDFILANTIVFYMQSAIKKNLAVFNLLDFRNLPNRQNKFYTKFMVYIHELFTWPQALPTILAAIFMQSL